VDEPGVPVRQGDRDAGGHRGTPVRRQDDVDAAHQVGPGVARMGVRGLRQVVVEHEEQDVEGRVVGSHDAGL
jgi:hypothetical protein